MRRTPVILALTAVVVAGLAGCSSAPAASCEGNGDTGLLDLVDVSGPVGDEPDVTVRAPFHVPTTRTALVDRPDGLALTEAGQLALVDVTVFSGDTGDSLVSTRYADDIAQVPSVNQLSATFPTLADDLRCATEGSRAVVALAPDDIPDDVAGQLSAGEDESLVLVVDVRKVYLAHADGADQFTESHGLPTVVRAPDGRPGIIVPDGEAPDDLVVQTIKRGDGPEVTEDSTARVHVTGVSWQTRNVTVSTWESGSPEQLSPGASNAPAFATALVGATVGSQVLVVVPADDAAGADATAYVIDILGLDS